MLEVIGRRRGRPRKISQAQLDRIGDLARDPEQTGASIRQALRVEYPDAAFHPTTRQVQTYVKAFREHDQGGPWSLSTASETEARLIPPVLAALADGAWWGRAEGLGASEARIVVRLLLAASDLPPAWAFWLARKYLTRQVLKQSTATLDLLVGFATWQGGDQFEAFRNFVHQHHPEQIEAREGTIADACRMEAERRGEPFTPETTFDELYQRYFKEGGKV